MGAGTQVSIPPVPDERFVNRELSWLEFNRRVLHEACDPRTPLLERVRFLGIFSSNLDEFFMKRVGGLKRQLAAGVRKRTSDGLTLPQQLAVIRQAILPVLQQQTECHLRTIRPELAARGIRLLAWTELTAEEREQAGRYFREQVFPVLTPLAVDPGHPFPFISNLSESLGVKLRQPHREEVLFARVKVPETFPRWIPLDVENREGYRFASLYDIMRHHLDALFPDMIILNVMLFRITRNAEVQREEADAEDLMELIEQELHERRFARVVRVEHGPEPDPWMLEFLMRELELGPEDVYEAPGELDYGDLKPICDLELPELRYPKWKPVVLPPWDRVADKEADLFSLIREGDLLVHHPYESFDATVLRFLEAAAEDPAVLAVKTTVYRTGDDSPFLHMLLRAAARGKQAVCLVELKARFDEERNIYWAQTLERAGVHVVYGIVGLKTHTKTTLVVRQEAGGLRSYAHIGTGNYNVQTARLYTDLGLFTCRPDITHDLVELFNYLTGRSLKRDYRKLLVAPVNMKPGFMELIEREIEHRRAGRPARVLAKINSLEDRDTCELLCQASQAGVPVDLLVRGFCCLRPGLPGVSENVRVLSTIGRFLEHSRVFYFRNGAAAPEEGEFFIGSADWMYRNLLSRVEVVAPVEDAALRRRLWEILTILLGDRRQVWEMRSDGNYVQRGAAPGDPSPEAPGAHQLFMDLALRRAGAK